VKARLETNTDKQSEEVRIAEKAGQALITEGTKQAPEPKISEEVTLEQITAEAKNNE